VKGPSLTKKKKKRNSHSDLEKKEVEKTWAQGGKGSKLGLIRPNIGGGLFRAGTTCRYNGWGVPWKVAKNQSMGKEAEGADQGHAQHVELKKKKKRRQGTYLKTRKAR